MGAKLQIDPEPRPVVDWLAGQIHDPVAKLRFLKIAAAHPKRPSPYKRRWSRPLYLSAAGFGLLSALFLVKATGRVGATPPPIRRAVPVQKATLPAADPPPIWEVEKSADHELYSNGLRIDTRHEVSTHPRRYLAFPAGPAANGAAEPRTTPAGIVFHATESRQAPFEERENRVLKKLGESTLDYVERKRAYNFVIDRFGRVYRVVRESDAANHAGYSIWADDRSIYINLNESFLGVSFEAAGEGGEDPAASPAQLRAAAMLVEMLRSLFHISARNCVTHAQVSVNPANMRVGYHTDWASGFPFAAVGLPDNYGQPLSAVARFGFECDRSFLVQAAAPLRSGIQAAESELAEQARKRGLNLAAYRLELHRRYRLDLGLVRHAAAGVLPPDSEQTSAIQ